MKSFLPLLFCFLFTVRLYAQNIVPNYSFEQIDSCPNELGLINLASPWFRPTLGTTDLFSHCLGTNNHHNVEVPKNWAGYQNAKTGESYAGFFVWWVSYDLGYREYLEAPLSLSLQSGVKYFVSFYVSLSDSSGITSDKVGAYFSTDSLLSNDFFPLAEVPQIKNESENFITDTSQWVQIKGSFLAIGGERFITIGNFYDDDHTDTLSVSGGMNYWNKHTGYFYIDDVCVSSDSNVCYSTVGISTISIASDIKVEQAMVANTLSVFLSQSETDLVDFNIFNQIGQRVVTAVLKYGENDLNLSSLPDGIYFYEAGKAHHPTSGKIMVMR